MDLHGSANTEGQGPAAAAAECDPACPAENMEGQVERMRGAQRACDAVGPVGFTERFNAVMAIVDRYFP